MSNSLGRKKFNFFDWAVTVLLVVFFIVGVLTCGSFQSTGDSLLIRGDSEHIAVFEANETQSIKSVYLNVGAIYADEGENLTITLKHTTSSATIKPTSSFGVATKIGNLYSKTGEGTGSHLYNWLEITVETAKRVKLLAVTADKSFQLNELVAVNEDGERVIFTPNRSQTAGYTDPLEMLESALDAQDSFTKSKSAKYNFTAEEGYTMTAVDNLRLGKSYVDDAKYNLDGRFNLLAAVLYAPAVFAFGPCTGAIRLTSLVFTTLALMMSYLLAKLLFKNGKDGFIFALFLSLSALTATAGTIGAPYAPVLFGLIASAYFMLRFFSHGISDDHPVRSALIVLWSGLFSALALAIDLTSIFAVAGILVLFYFGLRRQKAAHAYALEKLGDEPSEEDVARTHAIYAYKQKVSYGLAALSFIVGTFVLLLLSSVIGYNALVRAYDDPSTPRLGFMNLFAKGLATAWGSNVTQFTATDKLNPFALFIPYKSSTLYTTLKTSGKTATLSAFVNPVLSVLSLLSFVFCTYTLVKTIVKKDKTKSGKRIVRNYAFILSAVVLAFLQAAFTQNLSWSFALPLTFAMTLFVPFAYRIADESENKTVALVGNVLLITSVCALAVCFALALPEIFGFVSKFHLFS